MVEIVICAAKRIVSKHSCSTSSVWILSCLITYSAKMNESYGRCDVLVNNAAMAFKGSDPTPFAEVGDVCVVFHLSCLFSKQDPLWS